jgi:FkbM family methyltransferase
VSRSTYWAFYSLILTIRPDIICDIGSCDGKEAIRFKRLRPAGNVLAFEANKANYERIIQNDDVARLGIDVRHAAVSDRQGEVDFYEVDVPAGKPWAVGVSSLHRRGSSIAGGLVERRVTVEGVRMDKVLADIPGGRIGLWIDVEGAARTVLAGLSDAIDRVTFMHMETELAPLWVGEETSEQVARDLDELGFQIVARGRTDHPEQQNIVVVSKRLKNFAAHVTAAKAAARAFRLTSFVPHRG